MGSPLLGVFAYRLAVTGIHWSCICTVFFIVVARIAVNHDPACGTAPNPTVWSVGAPTKKKLRCTKPFVSLQLLPGPTVWVGGDGHFSDPPL